MKRFTVIYEFEKRRWSTSVEHWNVEAARAMFEEENPGQPIMEIYED